MKATEDTSKLKAVAGGEITKKKEDVVVLKRQEPNKVLIAAWCSSLDYKKAQDYRNFKDEEQLGACDKIEAAGKIRTLTVVPLDLAEKSTIAASVEESTTTPSAEDESTTYDNGSDVEFSLED